MSGSEGSPNSARALTYRVGYSMVVRDLDSLFAGNKIMVSRHFSSIDDLTPIDFQMRLKFGTAGSQTEDLKEWISAYVRPEYDFESKGRDSLKITNFKMTVLNSDHSVIASTTSFYWLKTNGIIPGGLGHFGANNLYRPT